MPAFFIYGIFNMKFSCIIPAAGKGNRFGSLIPKQFLHVQDAMIIEHAIHSIIVGFKTAGIEALSLVIPCDNEYQDSIYTCCIKYLPEHAFAMVGGGDTRQASILKATQHPFILDSDIVCIHDAARPFIPPSVMHNLISASQHHDCIIPVMDIIDTLKEVDQHSVLTTLDRTRYKLAQTPQFFKTKNYLDALQLLDNQTTFTDDSSLMEHAGYTVQTVQGSDIMKKVTHPYDLELAELHARLIKDIHE